VPIRASSARPIDALVADLASDQATTRAAAAARLTVFGARAVDRLIAVVGAGGPAGQRAQVFGVLEAVADPRALDAILTGMADPDVRVAAAATSATRPFLRGPRGATVVDYLTTAALDRARPEGLRIEAVGVLQELEPTTVGPLLASLAEDPSPLVQAAARSTSIRTPEEDINEAAEGDLPDEAQALTDALSRGADGVTLPILLRVIERVREREGLVPPDARRAWVVARGRAHAELATRGSRIALYDLREAVEKAAVPLPVDFLAALAAAGDASCLEPVARAHERATIATGDRDEWWRGHLVDAFRAIVTREGITRRHAVVRKLEKRHKPLVDEVWPPVARKAPRA
jgi:hypothetical protein